MSTAQRGRCLHALCLTACLFVGGTAWSQFEPVVVVTASSIDKLLSKASHLATLAGQESATQMLQGIVTMYSQGIDKSRPVAVALLADEQSFQVFGIVPVNDRSDWLKASPLGASAQELSKGVYQIQLGPRPVVVQFDDQGWAYLAHSEADLENRPKDPLDVTDGLEQQYDVAVRAYVQNIPTGVRDNAMAQYRRMMEMGLKQMESADSPQAQFQRTNMERQMKSVERMCDELDQFTLGILADTETEKVIAETTMSAVRGSRMERQIALMNQAKTHFANFFIPTATMTASFSANLMPEDIAEQSEQLESTHTLISSYLDKEFPGSESAKETLLSVVHDIMDIAKKSLESGELDAAGAAIIADGNLNLVGAARFPAADKLESIITRLGDVRKEAGNKIDVRVGFADYDGVKFHAAQVTLPESKELANAFGDKLTLYVGASPDNTYIGLGEKSLGAMRKLISASSGPPKPVQPMRFLLSVGDLLDFIAKVSGEEKVTQLAAAFREAGTDDKILISSKANSDGSAVTRIEVQQGVISGFGQAYGAQMAGR